MMPKLDFAVNWLLENPSQRYTPGRTLERTVKYPEGSITYRTWNMAKAVVRDAAPMNPLHKPEQVGDSTIIHINVTARTAHVVYNGADRTFKLKCIDPLALADEYVDTHGYKRTWLNENVILLTKKIKGARRLAA